MIRFPACLLALAAALPLAGCVASGNPSAARASLLANTVSRAVACRAGTPRADTLTRFLAAERARGASPEQVRGAREAYVAVSEADAVNHSVRPQACRPQEVRELRAAMSRIRAGRFDGE